MSLRKKTKTGSTWGGNSGQIENLRSWNGNALPPSLCGRIQRYVEDYDYLTKRIRGLEAERRRIWREDKSPALDKVRQLYTL